ADDAVFALMARGEVEIAIRGKGEALRAAESANVGRDVALFVDSMDAVVAGEAGCGDIEAFVGAKGDVIRRDRRFDRGEGLRNAKALAGVVGPVRFPAVHRSLLANATPGAIPRPGQCPVAVPSRATG